MPLRIYLVGRVTVEAPGGVFDERQLPGRQGRLVLARLGWPYQPAISRDELVDALWGAEPPPSVDTAVSAVISKLRQLFSAVGLPGSELLVNAFGCYQLRLPGDAVVDVAAANNAVHDAETLLRSDDFAGAYSYADVASHIAARPFLAGHDAEWVSARRTELRTLLVRAHEAQLASRIGTGNIEDGVQAADALLALEPCRESAYRGLMRLHAMTGNRASALQVYEQCRKTLAEELGVDPCPQTEEVYLEILRAG